MTDLRQLVDFRNAAIWDELNTHYTITVQPSLNLEYSCFTAGQTAIIYVVENNLSPDSFTHELLHIYLKHKDILIGPAFRRWTGKSTLLSALFTEPLLEHVSNCLDHIKMFALYEQMGFDPAKFLLDSGVHKCTGPELALLKKNYRVPGGYSLRGVDLYIGKFFAVCADFNYGLDYEPCLAELEKLDPALYRLLDRFILSWENYDIELNGAVFNSYEDLLAALYEDFKRWLTGKKFV